MSVAQPESAPVVSPAGSQPESEPKFGSSEAWVVREPAVLKAYEECNKAWLALEDLEHGEAWELYKIICERLEREWEKEVRTAYVDELRYDPGMVDCYIRKMKEHSRKGIEEFLAELPGRNLVRGTRRNPATTFEAVPEETVEHFTHLFAQVAEAQIHDTERIDIQNTQWWIDRCKGEFVGFDLTHTGFRELHAQAKKEWIEKHRALSGQIATNFSRMLIPRFVEPEVLESLDH